MQCSEIFKVLLIDSLNCLKNKIKECSKTTDGMESISIQRDTFIRTLFTVFVSKAKGRGLDTFIHI